MPEQVAMVPVYSYWTWFHKGRFFDEVRFLEWTITDISGKFPILLSGDEVFDRKDINKPYFNSFYEVLTDICKELQVDMAGS